MDSVTIREASENLAGLLDQVERGEDVVITRDGVPVARLVPAPPPRSTRRVLTPEQQKALEDSEAFLRQPRDLLLDEPFDRGALYMERFERK